MITTTTPTTTTTTTTTTITTITNQSINAWIFCIYLMVYVGVNALDCSNECKWYATTTAEEGVQDGGDCQGPGPRRLLFSDDRGVLHVSHRAHHYRGRRVQTTEQTIHDLRITGF